MHIQNHVFDLTRLSQSAGYHGGLSLNALAALMAEPTDKVLDALDDMVKQQLANPFGCAVTLCPIWYVKGISRDWDAYGGNSYGMSRDEQPFLEYTDVYNEAKRLGEQYPGKAFTGRREPTVQELLKVRDRLGVPIILESQSDGECLLCAYMATAPAIADAPDEEDYDDDHDDFEYEEREF
jgi:hypothetical protein